MIFLLSTLLFMQEITAQSTRLRAKFWYKGEAFTGNLSGRLGDARSFTLDSNGEIDLQISAEDEIRMSLNGNEWEIRSPMNGRILLPKNAELSIPILIAQKGEADPSSRIMNRLQTLMTSQQRGDKEIRAEVNVLQDSLKQFFQANFDATVKEMVEVLDGIREEREKLEEANAQQARAIQRRGQLKTLNQLTASMDFYVTRLADLQDAFEDHGKKALINQWAVEELENKIIAYNDAYERLDSLEQIILNQAAVYWPGAYEARAELKGLLTFTLFTVHDQQVKEAKVLTREITEFRDRRVPRREKRRKREIQRSVDVLVNDIRGSIRRIKELNGSVFQVLKPMPED
ncbi:MAG: hypothetical protein AAFR61_19835 [Bacteroidota bacterium]